MRSQYPALLGLVNVVLLVASTILMYLGSALVQFYLLDKLDFVSAWFSVVPHQMLGMGVSLFVVALYGCLVAGMSSRCNLWLYSLLMIVLFVVQLGGIFSAMELRGVINRGEFTTIDVLKDLHDYKENPATRNRWDSLHREFACCGGVQHNDGYKVWRNADIGLEDHSVPDSCCLRPEEGCGGGKFTEKEIVIDRTIYTHGCITIMEPKLNDQVVPVLLGYAGVGVVLALLQLLAVVFACSFSASISRYEQQREEKLTNGYNANTLSMPSTPRFDHVRAQYGQENMSSVFSEEQYDELKGRFVESPTSQLREREV